MDQGHPFIEPERAPAGLDAAGATAPGNPAAPPPEATTGRSVPATRSRVPRLGRTAATLLLAAGLFGIGGASVVLAASPAPSAPTAPSTQGGGTYGNGSGPAGSGAMPGGCAHSGTNGSSGSSGGSGG